MTTPLLGLLLVLPTAGKPAPETAPTADAVRASVQRSLPFLEKEGQAWITDRKCMSCHVVGYMLWGFNEARAAGVKVDAKKLDEWNAWSLNYSLDARQWFRLGDTKQLEADGVPAGVVAKLKPLLNKPFTTEAAFLEKVGQAITAEELNSHKTALVKRAALPRTGEKNDGGSMATMGQLLVGRGTDKNALLEAFLEAAPEMMRRWQEANGSWKATGQLPRQNRSAAESDEVTTAWAILGLSSLNSADPATKKMIDAALPYFKKTKVGKSHESLLVHLLIEDRFGTPDEAGKLLQEVLKRQNGDGSWAWVPGGSGDAFATGQTLYALSSIGLKADTRAVGRGQKYLLDSQNKDGSWAVPPAAVTDPKSNDARIAKLEPIYHFWGTAWAAIGLSRSLSQSK